MRGRGGYGSLCVIQPPLYSTRLSLPDLSAPSAPLAPPHLPYSTSTFLTLDHRRSRSSLSPATLRTDHHSLLVHLRSSLPHSSQLPSTVSSHPALQPTLLLTRSCLRLSTLSRPHLPSFPLISTPSSSVLPSPLSRLCLLYVRHFTSRAFAHESLRDLWIRHPQDEMGCLLPACPLGEDKDSEEDDDGDSGEDGTGSVL